MPLPRFTPTHSYISVSSYPAVSSYSPCRPSHISPSLASLHPRPFLSPIPFKFDKSSDRSNRLASAPTELESNTLNLLTDRVRSRFQPYYPLQVFRFLTRFCLYRFDILTHLTKWDEFSSREGLVFVLYRFRAPFFRDLETKNRKKMTDYNSDVHQKPFFSVLFHS